ncbi:MAG: efflux RND transporter periplasmic adaptor subunit [Acidiferrobacterales bacterium]|nr:efflux RND transporter periplasmic adaptor subunit [Acidiferrobacterales bacterium]
MYSEQDYNYGDEKQESRFGSLVSGIFTRKVRIVLCIILIAFGLISLLTIFKPEAAKVAIPETIVRVDTIIAERSSYPIVVNANGTVEAETRGNLVAQVSGEIVEVANNFTTGGRFKKGDVLVQIDQRDYQANLSQASASLSQADSAYRQELATAKQAEEDWRRLGNTDSAPDLVMRKPQLAAAKALLDSAQAAHQTAELNLTRTTITAPYDGRVIQRQAVLGQFVTMATPIAEVFSTGRVELRLPISQQEFNQLGLNEFSTTDSSDEDFNVLVSSSIGTEEYFWNASIVRTDSTYDINTRQIDVIAEIQDPFSKTSNQPPLKIGQFVNASIQGRTVDDVYVIPNKSIREGGYVYAVREGKLAKLNVAILWQDDQNALVSDGIDDGELVVTTSLNSTLTGASAKLNNEEESGGESAQDNAAAD